MKRRIGFQFQFNQHFICFLCVCAAHSPKCEANRKDEWSEMAMPCQWHTDIFSTFRCSAFNIQYGHWSGQARGWYLKMLIVGKNGNSLVGRRLSTRDFHTLRMQKYQSIRVIIIIGRVRCIAFEWWCGMLAIRLYVRPYVRLLNALIRFDFFLLAILFLRFPFGLIANSSGVSDCDYVFVCVFLYLSRYAL